MPEEKKLTVTIKVHPISIESIRPVLKGGEHKCVIRFFDQDKICFVAEESWDEVIEFFRSHGITDHQVTAETAESNPDLSKESP